MAATHMDAVFEEEAFDETFFPALPIAAAPLANVTNLAPRVRKPAVSVQVRQDGKRHYAALKQIAEEYAVLKKQAEKDEAGAEAGLWQLCHRGRASLVAHGAAVPAVKQQAGSATAALQHLVRSFVPEEAGEALSIGSIPHASGDACSAGACRFHKKGKCFDGLLCRFCHCAGEHPKPAARPKALPRAPQRGRAMEPADANALAALFAALDSAVMPQPGGRLPVVPEVCTWPPRRA